MKRTFIPILFFGSLLLIGSFWSQRNFRGQLESVIVLPLFSRTITESAKSVKLQSLQEKIARLSLENRRLREQLGAIPERANLVPATVVSETPNSYFLTYPYSAKSVSVGQPVVLGEVYLGRVERSGGRMVAVEKPVSSGFEAQGRSQKGTEGRILGKFNEQVFFETGVNNRLAKGEAVYYIEPQQGWRFLLGTVAEISRDKRLPIKQALIEYLPQQATLTTVFIVE
jgi:hypothetical protein